VARSGKATRPLPVLPLALGALAACSQAPPPVPAPAPTASLTGPRKTVPIAPDGPVDVCAALKKPFGTLRQLAALVGIGRSMPIRPLRPEAFIAELDADAARANAVAIGDSDLATLASDTGNRLTVIAGSARVYAAAKTEGDAEAARTKLLEEMERGELPVALGDQQCVKGESAAGRLSAVSLQRAVRAGFDGFKTCHEAGLKRHPGLRGTVRVRFTVSRDGKVSEASDADSGAPDPIAWGSGPNAAPLPDPEVSACVVAAFRKLSFPRPQGGTFSVTYPIELGPAR
jgi:hypothetical protein